MDFSFGEEKDISPVKDQVDQWPESEQEKQLSILLFGDRSTLLENLSDKAPKFEVDTDDSNKSKKRNPAWVDSDDEDIDKNVAPRVNKKRKRDRLQLQTQMTSTYTENLKMKFERLVGQPEWASLDKPVREADSDDEILQSIGHIKKTERDHKSSNLLDYKRVADLNKASYKEGPVIAAIEFHPTSSIAVVAGKFGIASMFSVDGQDNNKLHTLGMKDFHITCCRFSATGEEIIFGGPKRHYHVYDLMSGKSNTQRLPPALTHLKKFELSACGQWMAVAGRFGEVHLFNAFSKELIHSLKQESPCTALSFSHDSKHLYSHSDTGEVTVFDIRAAKVCHRWTDEGCINGSSIAVSENDQFVATGSAQGVVNVYERAKVFENKMPKPEKAIMNLTTEITNTVFHPSSEMLCISSGEVFDAIRMIQLPKLQAFQNFPLQAKNKMGYPRVVRFSPGGGYMAIAGTKALLYRLKSFNSY